MSSLSSSLSWSRSGAGAGLPVDVFAAGHLGELTRYVPVELVDDVLAQARVTQRRLRVLPSRVGVYFLLALAMFPQLGYLQVWDKLTAGLVGAPQPSEKALRDLRRRLGAAPMRALFEVLAGPVAQPSTRGVSYRGLRTVAFDGLNSLDVPDTRANRAWLSRRRNQTGLAGYPNLRVLALVETGTRGLLGATLGSGTEQHEPTLAQRLLGLVKPGMLVLADRAYDCDRFPAQVAATGAQLLIRCKYTRVLPAHQHLPDGSYLSRVGDLPVRVIDVDLTARTRNGQRIGDRYRLITTLTDHRYPARELVTLYHQRWEIESAFLALRHTILHGHVLRSADRFGLEQELWALLTLYQLLRMAMVTATETRPGTDPACFTTALETARNQVTAARGIQINDTDLTGTIGRAILRTLLPPRRTRTSIRKVKRPTSRYAARQAIRTDPRPPTSTPITSITTTINTPPPAPPPPAPPPPAPPPPAPPPPAPPPQPPRTTPQPHTRRARVTHLMNTHPHRSWNGNHLAQQLNIPRHNLLTQLAEWARHGLLTKTGPGTYTLNNPPTLTTPPTP